MENKINGFFTKLFVAVVSIMLVGFSGLTSYFVYATFDSVQEIKDDYFELKGYNIDMWEDMTKNQDDMMDTLNAHWQKSLEIYNVETNPNTKRSKANLRAIITNKKDIQKVKTKVGLY